MIFLFNIILFIIQFRKLYMFTNQHNSAPLILSKPHLSRKPHEPQLDRTALKFRPANITNSVVTIRTLNCRTSISRLFSKRWNYIIAMFFLQTMQPASAFKTYTYFYGKYTVDGTKPICFPNRYGKNINKPDAER